MPCCDQRFWVVDESGVGLNNALVKARKSVQTGFWEVTSDTTNGSAVLTLDQGDTYTVTVTKSGYTSTPVSKVFKPCIGTINFTLKESAMGEAKACDIFRFPQTNVVLDPGDDLYIKLGVSNCGNETSNFYYEIFLDGHRCDSRHNVWLEPGQNSYDVLRCDLVMGTSKKTFIQAGGHAEGTRWIEDFRYTHTITPRTYTLTISPTTHSSPASGDLFNINVTSNTTWSVSEYKSWLRCSPISGNGNGRISVTVDANTSTSTRKGTIHVTHNGMTRSCTITQAGAIPPPYLTISPTTHSSPASGDSFSITIRTNVFWTVTEPSWMNSAPFTGTGNNTTTITVAANTSETPRTGTISIYAPGSGITRTCLVTQSGAVCTYGDWIKGECVSDTHRAYRRTCTPPGCDIEYEERPDPTCETGIICADFPPEECVPPCYLWSDNTCHNIPEGIPDRTDTKITWEEWKTKSTVNEEVVFAVRLMTDKLISLGINGVPINFYANNVLLNEEPIITTDAPGIIGLNGYADIKYTFIEAGLYDVKAVFPGAEDFNASESEIRTITISGAELALGKIESITCTATKEAEGKYEVSATVTVKNIDTKVHEYYIRMYDDATGNHLDDEPDMGGIHVEPGETTDIELSTYDNPLAAATTPTIKFDLWETTWIDEPVESQTKSCTETSIGEITNISCISTQEAENDYEIEAIVKFKNPDTISHLYKVELLDAETGDHKDWEPDPYQAGKEVQAGETSTIVVNTIGTTNCVSPKITIKLWETTGFKAIADEQEKDCSEGEPSMFASLISFLMDSFSITESQAKLMVYGGGGLLALSFIMPMFRR